MSVDPRALLATLVTHLNAIWIIIGFSTLGKIQFLREFAFKFCLWCGHPFTRTQCQERGSQAWLQGCGRACHGPPKGSEPQGHRHWAGPSSRTGQAFPSPNTLEPWGQRAYHRALAARAGLRPDVPSETAATFSVPCASLDPSQSGWGLAPTSRGRTGSLN